MAALVSIPTWARLSWKVPSRLHRFLKSGTISSAGGLWSVEKRAFGGRFPAGSRVSTQRMGKGVEPNRYHQAVPVHRSKVRRPSPYQSTLTRSHAVLGSDKTCSREGSRSPTTRGRPIVWGSRPGAGWCIMESSRNGAIRVTGWRAQGSPSSPDAATLHLLAA